VDGRTLVPVRGVFEHLGFHVEWDGEMRAAILVRADFIVIIALDTDIFMTNGVIYSLEVPAQSIGGRTMLPIRAVLESVGYNVGWDGASRTVQITSGVTTPPPPTTPTPPAEILRVDVNSPRIDANAPRPTYEVPRNYTELNEEIIRAIIRYSPLGRFLMAVTPAEESKSPTVFVDFHSQMSECFFANTQTVAHYLYHGFHIWEFDGFDTISIRHLAANEEIWISDTRLTDIIHTEHAARRIPSNLRTFRFNDYLSPGNELSANVWGAFGLLDELGAYFYDLIVTLDMTDYVLEFITRNGMEMNVDHPSIDLTNGYISMVYSSVLAIYEFTFWMIDYLIFLEQNHPQDFALLNENENFRRVFSYMYNRGQRLINTTAPTEIERIYDHIRSRGIQITVDGIEIELEHRDTEWIRTVTMTVSSINEIEILRNALTTQPYADMLARILRVG
jgi:uncharacterized pyridoxamine 5'-phosphate oxidase family protein